jgi:hypothetical protein
MTLWNGAGSLAANLERLSEHAQANETTLSIQRTPLGRWVISLGDLVLSDADQLELAVTEAVHWAAVRSW